MSTDSNDEGPFFNLKIIGSTPAEVVPVVSLFPRGKSSRGSGKEVSTTHLQSWVDDGLRALRKHLPKSKSTSSTLIKSMATATWNFPRPFFPQTRTMSTTITPATRLSFSNPTDLRSFLPSISLHAPSGLSNGVFCRTSGYNVQIVVGEDEPEEVLMRRFRREVSRAGIIPECRRRKYFENKQEAKKRKTREAAKRNRRRPRFTSSSSSSSFSNKKDAPPKKAREEDSDNWEMPDGDLPFF